jgi:hypothetical protein
MIKLHLVLFYLLQNLSSQLDFFTQKTIKVLITSQISLFSKDK